MRLGLTNHAVERYVERVKPTFDFSEARRELQRLCDLAGEPSRERPDWHFLPEHATEAAEFYLTLSDGICAAVKGTDVVTVLTRGGSSPAHRANKRERKRRQRARRRGKPQINTRNGRQEAKTVWR